MSEPQQHSNRLLRRVLPGLLIAACVFIAYVVGLVGGKPHSDIESMPATVLLEKTNPEGTVTAQILQGRMLEKWNFLGSDVRFHLALKFQTETCVLSRELTGGMGTYEGGMLDLKWLDNRQIVIHRAVADQASYLVFDIVTMKWRDSVQVAD